MDLELGMGPARPQSLESYLGGVVNKQHPAAPTWCIGDTLAHQCGA